MSSNPSVPKPTQQQPRLRISWSTRLQACCKFFKVQILNGLSPWTVKVEPSKIAIQHDYTISLLHGLSHLIPLGVCLAFSIVNATGLFLGDVSSSVRTALQFPSKFVEVLIQTSLGVMLLSFVRYHLFQSQSVPFGTLLAPASISNLAYCWSIDLWGASTTKRPLRLTQHLLLISIPVLIALAAVVGPSTAILIIPREMNSTDLVQRTILDNSTAYRLPSINSNTIDYEALNGSIGQFAILQGSLADCSGLSLDTTDGSIGMQCNATSPDSGLYDNLGHYFFPSRTVARFLSAPGDIFIHSDTERYLSTRYPQPAIHFGCNSMSLGSGLEINETYLKSTSISFENNGNTSLFLSSIFQLSDFNLTSRSSSKIAWIQRLEGDANKHSIYFAAFSWEWSTGTTFGTQPPSNAGAYRFSGKACTLDAMWYNTTASRSMNKRVAGIITPDPLDPNERPIDGPTPIGIDFAQDLSNAYSRRDPVEVSSIYIAQKYARLIAYGLLSIMPPEPESRQMQTNGNNLNHQQQALIDDAISNGHFRPYDEVMTTSNWTSLDQVFTQHTIVQQAGYGYNLIGVTPKLAFAVLVFYSLLATLYLLLTCITGYTSASWDSISELMMLAFNSNRPTFLGRTSAGIETLNTFRQPVSLKVNEADELELVFDNDPSNNKSSYRAIEVNKTY